jgi:hypothetical protein
MRTWKILLHLLLTLLLSIGASGVVSAKVASGDQNLTWTGHQAENVFNWLTCQGKSNRSTTGPPECSVVPKRRTQTPGDKDFKTEKAARREAIRRNGGQVSEPNNFKRETNWDKNPNLKGPNGEPSEFLDIKDLNGNDVRIDHHNWGHQFKDNNTFEYPHYQGPNGEHLSYPPRGK